MSVACGSVRSGQVQLAETSSTTGRLRPMWELPRLPKHSKLLEADKGREDTKNVAYILFIFLI